MAMVLGGGEWCLTDAKYGSVGSRWDRQIRVEEEHVSCRGVRVEALDRCVEGIDVWKSKGLYSFVEEQSGLRCVVFKVKKQVSSCETYISICPWEVLEHRWWWTLLDAALGCAEERQLRAGVLLLLAGACILLFTSKDVDTSSVDRCWCLSY